MARSIGEIFEEFFGGEMRTAQEMAVLFGGPRPAAKRRGRGKSQKNLHLIEVARAILEEIKPATVRAVCYQLFNRGLIPDMSVNSTKRVSIQLTDAREQGLIPWAWIVDETRGAEGTPGWDDPEEFADAATAQYRRDRWTDQGVRVEVWSEKGTVRGTVLPVLKRYGIQFRVMHGFGSATEVHQVAQLAAGMDVPLIALYVGDWDPSGLYMSEVDLPTRLAEYGAKMDHDICLRRIALVQDDTTDLGVEPSFSVHEKAKDARYRWFLERHGDRCWELDAMSPVDLRSRVEAWVKAQIRSEEAWALAERAEEVERESLVEMLSKWTTILKGEAENDTNA